MHLPLWYIKLRIYYAEHTEYLVLIANYFRFLIYPVYSYEHTPYQNMYAHTYDNVLPMFHVEH